MDSDHEAADRRAIRDLLENWVVWRDAGHWERFRGVWHSDGRMMATWFQGTGDEFIAMSQASPVLLRRFGGKERIVPVDRDYPAPDDRVSMALLVVRDGRKRCDNISTGFRRRRCSSWEI